MLSTRQQHVSSPFLQFLMFALHISWLWVKYSSLLSNYTVGWFEWFLWFFLLKGMVGGSYRLILYYSEDDARACCDHKLNLTYRLDSWLFVEPVSCSFPHKHAGHAQATPHVPYLWLACYFRRAGRNSAPSSKFPLIHRHWGTLK